MVWLKKVGCYHQGVLALSVQPGARSHSLQPGARSLASVPRGTWSTVCEMGTKDATGLTWTTGQKDTQRTDS